MWPPFDPEPFSCPLVRREAPAGGGAKGKSSGEERLIHGNIRFQSGNAANFMLALLLRVFAEREEKRPDNIYKVVERKVK